MAEQVNIASLTIDVDDVVKETAFLKRKLDELKKAQKELDTTTKEGSEAFVENEVRIKQLSKSYKDNKNFASALRSANEDLQFAMTTQNKSTQELRDSRSQLNQISKNIIGNSEEEIELRNKLNAAIDEQTEALRDQSSNFNKNKDRVGEYKDSIIEAVAELTKQKEETLNLQKQLASNQKQLKKGTLEYDQASKAIEETNYELVEIGKTMITVQSELKTQQKALPKTTEEYKNMSKALVVVDDDLREVNKSLGEGKTSISDLDFSMNGLIKSSEESGGTMKLLSGGIKSGTKAMGGFIKSTLTFLATPVGIVLAAIAGAFLLIKNAMNRSEDSTNKIKKAMSGFAGIVTGLMKLLAPLGDFLIDGLVKGFELVEKGISKALTAIQKGLRFLGLDSAADALGNFTEKVEASAKASRELTQAEIDLQKAQRLSRKIQLDYQKDAEKLRQIRDNETKSFEERIAANNALGESLKKQSQEELAIANKALQLADLRIKLEGESTAALNERAEALTEIADIQERISGQESEQIVNRVSLEKEAAAEIQELREAEFARLEADAEKKAELAEKEKEKALELAAAEDERKAIDAENKFAILEQELENEFELNQAYLDRQREAELFNAEKTGADKALINKKYNLAEKRLAAEITAFKQQQNAQILSGLVSLFGESSKIGKAFAIAEIVNNTALNASKAFAQAAVFASNPLTLPLAFNANLQGGLIVALGAAQVAKTSGLKLAGGGMVRGAGSGKSDSIPALLSNGESVNSANSTRMFAPLYSYLNELGGGSRFASGGIAGSSSSGSASIIDYDVLAAKMSEAFASLPAPQVSVEEINTISKNIQVIENLATG